MTYHINQNNPEDDESSNNNVPSGKIYTEEELMEKVYEKCKHLSKHEFEEVIIDLKKAIIEVMEEGRDLEIPWLKLFCGINDNSTKPDTDHPSNDRPQ